MKDKSEIVVTVHVAPNCSPETLKALSEMMNCLIKQVQKTDSDQVLHGVDCRCDDCLSVKVAQWDKRR